MGLELSSLRKSIEALQRALSVLHSDVQIMAMSPEAQETVRSGVIQSFDVAYEQSWKMMKRWLETEQGRSDVDGVTRRELFRIAAEAQLLSNVDDWMGFHFARNTTSHTYDGQVAEEVLAVVAAFCEAAQRLYAAIECRND